MAELRPLNCRERELAKTIAVLHQVVGSPDAFVGDEGSDCVVVPTTVCVEPAVKVSVSPMDAGKTAVK